MTYVAYSPLPFPCQKISALHAPWIRWGGQ
jgi:hypothetical protein